MDEEDVVAEPIPGVIITELYGKCPLQGEGTINGLPFYFRSRHEHWTLSLALTADGDAIGVNNNQCEGYTYREHYGEFGGHDAGYMESDEGIQSIARAAHCLQTLLAHQKAREIFVWDIASVLKSLHEYRYTLEHYRAVTQNNAIVYLKAETGEHGLGIAELHCLHPDMATALTRARQSYQCCTPFWKAQGRQQTS